MRKFKKTAMITKTKLFIRYATMQVNMYSSKKIFKIQLLQTTLKNYK